MGGFVENQNVYEYGVGSLQGNLTLRVPEGKFTETLAQVKLFAVRVQNEQIDSSDVSAQVVDLEARLKSKRAEEAQYILVMKDAKKISDILEVTRMLSSVRGEIEQIQGQVNYFARQTSMSTIHIALTPVANAKEVTNEWRPALVVKESFKNLLVGLTGFVSGLIVFVIQVLPMLILHLALIAFAAVVSWKLGKTLFYRLSGKTLPPKQG
jgi:predicted house-cleaning noncanonical NTP pyrophosphatase (MazG superfamily)